ncbi:MAG: hypothetical protein JW727_06300 [Candidatus Aenigmarchaeota archaeon]|nr:hypothetical protein [Candidatus Aenigmarchaeota archaeon]
MTKIFIFGDSLPYGKWDSEKAGWANRLRVWLDEKVLSGHGYYETFNFGVPGDFSEGLLNRFESDLKPRFRDGEDIAIIFQIGINDTQFIPAKSVLKSTKEEFEKNIGHLAAIALKYTSKVAFLGLTPIDEEKTLTVPWYHDSYYKNKSIQEYNEIIKEVCEKKQVYFLGLFEKLNQKKYFDNLVDGLHPNALGHEWLFKFVRDFVQDKNFLG